MPAAGRRRRGQAAKERQIAQEFVEHGMNGAATGRALGISTSSVSTALAGPAAQGVILDFIRQQYAAGLDPASLFAFLKQKLAAQKAVVTLDGQVVMVNDNQTQMEALKLAFELPFKAAGVMAKAQRPEEGRAVFQIDLDKLAGMSDEELLTLHEQMTRHHAGKGR